MRQVYSLLLLAATGFAGFTGEAKTFTISVDNPDAVVVRDPSNGTTLLISAPGTARQSQLTILLIPFLFQPTAAS